MDLPEVSTQPKDEGDSLAPLHAEWQQIKLQFAELQKSHLRRKDTLNLTINELEDYLLEHYSKWCIDQSLFMKLVEEIGEVAEVLNKKAGRKASDDEDLQSQLGKELADVIHYAVAIAALNGIDMNGVILAKDKEASIKYNRSINLEQFILNKRNQKTY